MVRSILQVVWFRFRVVQQHTLVGVILITCGVSVANAQQASYSNGVATLPLVEFQGNFYTGELTLISGTSPEEFDVSGNSAVGPADQFTSIYDGFQLLIPSLDALGNDYWVILDTASYVPLRLRLFDYGLNDADDDDDTIPDIDDVDQYTPNDVANDPMGINGSWLLFLRVETASGDCIGEVGELSDDETMTFTYLPGNATYDYDVQSFTPAQVSVSQRTFSVSGSFADDNGTTVRQNMTLTIHPATAAYPYKTLTGTENWTWSDTMGNSCPMNSSKVWGTSNSLETNPPIGF